MLQERIVEVGVSPQLANGLMQQLGFMPWEGKTIGMPWDVITEAEDDGGPPHLRSFPQKDVHEMELKKGLAELPHPANAAAMHVQVVGIGVLWPTVAAKGLSVTCGSTKPKGITLANGTGLGDPYKNCAHKRAMGMEEDAESTAKWCKGD